MLSLSPGGMSAAHAAKYFSQEDYYLQGGEPSQWLGKGSEALGLEGQISEQEFRKLVEGKAPDGAQLVAPKITWDQGGRQVETHRAGNDLTFSAPKSVSVGYAAGNRELKEIWDQAVVNTMKHVEAHYSNYRTPDGVMTSGNIVAAKFDHVTSRALDPEVHSHVFLVNMTLVRGGGWKANEPKNIYTDKIPLGMLARQEAIYLYQQAGYETYFTERQRLFFEIRGVRDEELETFSKRSAAIAARVAKWKEEKRFSGVSDSVLKQMAALDTRDPKREVTREDVRREWDRGFESAGTTAQEVRERILAARHLPGVELPGAATEPDKDAGKRSWQVLKPGTEEWSNENAGFVEVLLERRRKEYLYGDTAGTLSNDQLRDYAKDGNPTAQPEIDRRYINEAYLDFEAWSTPSEIQSIGETIEGLEGLREAVMRHNEFLDLKTAGQEENAAKALVLYEPSGSTRKRIEFLRRVDARIKELNSSLVEVDQPLRLLAPGNYPKTLATVIHHTKVPTLKKQSGYEAAKRGGDINAARDVVDALVKRNLLDGIKGQVPANRAIYVVPVVQKEGSHLNMLPVAYAEKLAEYLGGEVWTKIHKLSGTHNTGASLVQRMHNKQLFRGELPPEGSVVIVADDAFTVGGTLTALIDHLEQGGNRPLFATTLATGRYGEKLAPTRELINGLLEKTGIDQHHFKQEFGYAPLPLTGAEIRAYLQNGARGIAGARARFPAGGTGKSFGHPETQAPHLESYQEWNDPPPGSSSGAVVKLAGAFLNDKEAAFDRAELLKTAAQISGGKHSLDELNAAIDSKSGRANGIHRMGRETHGWQAGKVFYTTREMQELEARNLNTLKNLPPFQSVTSRAEVEAYLAGRAKERPVPGALHQAAYQAGLDRPGRLFLSDGQRSHVLNELAGSGGFAITQGDPGTGKTFAGEMVEHYNQDVLQPSGRRHLTLNVAYTSKAALEMSRTSGKPAYTVDAFLNRWQRGKIREDISAQQAPNGLQVIIKADEASFIGGRQAEHLLQALREIRREGVEAKLLEIGDSKQMQSIQASPFFLHASELARQGAGDYAQLKEIRRQRNPALRQVAEILNREGSPAPEYDLEGENRKPKPLDARQQLGANAQEALTLLEKQGRVREIPERQELVRAAVCRYIEEASKPSPDPPRAAAGEKQSVILVTPLNLDRQELNDRIRKAREEAGELGPGASFAVYSQVRQGVTSSGYRPGMALVFNGERGRDGKMRAVPGTYLNQQGEIQSVNPEANTVTVRLGIAGEKSDLRKAESCAVASPTGERGAQAARNLTRTFDATALAGKTTLYLREQREFAEGDRVIFKKSTEGKSVQSTEGKGAKVSNNEMGEIEQLLPSGTHTAALIRLEDGRRINLQLDRFGPQHIDHGYAVTIYGAQGGTVDQVLPFHYVKPGMENDQKHFEKLTGVKISTAQFRQWDAGLSETEKHYQATVKLGGHSGEMSFLMVRDRNTDREQKGVAIAFQDGPALVADQETRENMREAGMYWSKEARVWISAVTNERAMGLTDRHPLKDPAYLARLTREFAPEPGKRQESSGRLEAGSVERNHQTEIDSAAESARFGRASYNNLNVALTRSRYEVELYTNSLTGLKRAVLSVDQKTSTVGKDLTARVNRFSKCLRSGREDLERAALAIKRPEPKPKLMPAVKPVFKADPGLELKR